MALEGVVTRLPARPSRCGPSLGTSRVVGGPRSCLFGFCFFTLVLLGVCFHANAGLWAETSSRACPRGSLTRTLRCLRCAGFCVRAAGGRALHEWWWRRGCSSVGGFLWDGCSAACWRVVVAAGLPCTPLAGGMSAQRRGGSSDDSRYYVGACRRNVCVWTSARTLACCLSFSWWTSAGCRLTEKLLDRVAAAAVQRAMAACS